MAQTEASGFWGVAPGLGTVAVEPRMRIVIASPGVIPFTRKYHQHGQPRTGSPPGMKLILRVASSISMSRTEPPSKSDTTVNGSAAMQTPHSRASLNATKDTTINRRCM